LLLLDQAKRRIIVLARKNATYFEHGKIELMILLDRVTKTYSKNVGTALDRVSLHVEPNEFVIIVGQSGAGKTTLMRLLTREERPTSGKIIVGGIDYDKLKDRDIPLLRRKIGVVFH
jgi:cell division transport system ATP-binding protein